jgi:5-deoxy-glucuronate isomerase
LRWRHHQFPPCHVAVATLAVTSARVLGSRSAAVLLKARLTAREFSACCTALAFRVALKCLAASAEAPTAAVVPIAACAPRPHCLYVPNDETWEAVAETDCTVAVCSAPGKSGHKARRIGPEGIALTERGKGTNTRYINNIAMENEDYCDSLLVTEVFTPAGHWSSYPSHRHDEDDFPLITYLEETYYHRINPASGFGIQRVYTDDLQLNETMAVHDGDVVLAPRGHHPCGAPYGFEMYYLNVMAGPRRK